MFAFSGGSEESGSLVRREEVGQSGPLGCKGGEIIMAMFIVMPISHENACFQTQQGTRD